jgi:hypothetical protein
MSSSSQLHHAGTTVDSPVVNPDAAAPTTPLSPDSAQHDGVSERVADADRAAPEGRRTTVDRMTENMIYALLEDKRRELDDEIAAFEAAKNEELRIFERDLREGRSVGVTKKKGRDTEAFHTAKKRHRGNGYGISSPPSSNSSSPKAPAAHLSSEGRGLRNHDLSGDQTPQQTPPHEHELEFQGLFTPAYMPLLDCGGHRSLGRPKSEGVVRPCSPKSSFASSHLEEGASAPLTRPSFTRPAPLKLTLPHNTRSSSLPSAPQQTTTSLSRRSGSTTSLQSSIRQSSDDQKPRAPKQVKFKFDNIIVLPTASYDRSQEPIANMSDNTEQTTDREFNDMQRGVSQAKITSSQKMFSTSPLSEPSSSARSPSFSQFTPEPSPSNHQQTLQMEGNGSLDGLGGKWSKIKEKEVIGGSGAVQDEIAEVISRAEYEEAEDEDDYADGGLFDLDETVADLPEHKEADDEMENGHETTVTNTTNMPIISPSFIHGYDLSLVIPTTTRSPANRYRPSLNHTRPAAITSSLPTDISFGSKWPRNPTATSHRSTSTGNSIHTSKFKEEPGIQWNSMRRRSSAKYGAASPEDEPVKSRRPFHRNGVRIPEERGDEEDLALSPTAASLPVRIPHSPVMGYTDNGDLDSNSYTPKTKSDKSSVSSRKGKKPCDKENNIDVPTTNEPTATNTFSLSMSARTTSVDNPITDQFATATIGGLHRNAFSTDPDSPGSYRPHPIFGNINGAGNGKDKGNGNGTGKDSGTGTDTGNGDGAGTDNVGGIGIDKGDGTGDGVFMGNPFIGGSYASPSAIALAEAADVGSYVGSIDGCSGYDPADRASYLKLKRGRNGGEPQSFGERMMLEDEKKAKKLMEKAMEKKNVRRVTQP